MLYNDRSIGDVLDLTFEEAAEFFRANPRIHRPLALLVETGLGYLKLGQPSPTLSGGGRRSGLRTAAGSWGGNWARFWV